MNQEQFDKYQQFTEKTIHDLSEKVTELENKLNMFTNLLEISKYMNQHLKDPNLFSLINDMIIGVFGAKYSTIYIVKDGDLEAAARSSEYSFLEAEKKLILENQMGEFIINSNKPIYNCKKEEEKVYSSIGVSIRVDNLLYGYIIVQHKELNYFSEYHSKFLSSIGNHIGVVMENSHLQKKILHTDLS